MEPIDEKTKRVADEIQAILERENMTLIPMIQLAHLPEEPQPSPIIIPSDR